MELGDTALWGTIEKFPCSNYMLLLFSNCCGLHQITSEENQKIHLGMKRSQINNNY